jgi:hypothetical protein
LRLSIDRNSCESRPNVAVAVLDIDSAETTRALDTLEGNGSLLISTDIPNGFIATALVARDDSSSITELGIFTLEACGLGFRPGSLCNIGRPGIVPLKCNFSTVNLERKPDIGTGSKVCGNPAITDVDSIVGT